MIRLGSEIALPMEFGNADDPATIVRALGQLHTAADACGYVVTRLDHHRLLIRPPHVSFRVRGWPKRFAGAQLSGGVVISINHDGHALVCRWRRDDVPGPVFGIGLLFVAAALAGSWPMAMLGAISLVAILWEGTRTIEDWVEAALSNPETSDAPQLPPHGAA